MYVVDCLFMCVYMYSYILIAIFINSLLGEDYLCYLEPVSYPFDLINNIICVFNSINMQHLA